MNKSKPKPNAMKVSPEYLIQRETQGLSEPQRNLGALPTILLFGSIRFPGNDPEPSIDTCLPPCRRFQSPQDHNASLTRFSANLFINLPIPLPFHWFIFML